MCKTKTNPLIFDIQRGTYLDGPGLRTAVFVKGCPLSCQWCHNPESQSRHSQRMYYSEKCKLCLRCVEHCPSNALSVSAQENSVLCNVQKCTICRKCEDVCPTKAVSICGYETTVEYLCRIINKDRIFYETSGGGVTISGGECLMFPEFVSLLSEQCKNMGIGTAIDTAGNVPWSNFEKVLKFADMFLYDIKCISPDRHRKYTGVGNETIISNYLKLIRKKIDVIVRIPLIVGFNSDEDEFLKISDFLHNNPPKKVEILPYHSLGEPKYTALGLKAPSKFSTPSAKILEEYRKVLSDI